MENKKISKLFISMNKLMITSYAKMNKKAFSGQKQNSHNESSWEQIDSEIKVLC